ncbi:MAG: type II secretion system GspH family protein [Verrucomicrobia bacterium]|jgi:prepilin-type N-terminal cleavage/methylation domain-containing protein|nr:type II secretion system GspH family protein [Verrucomicrobiota bacterium]
MSAALSIARIQPPGPLGARRDHGVPLSRIGRGCRRGFTLIEIMIVISIMMVVMTVGIPAFVRALDKQGLRKAVNDVVEGCSHARSQAILRGVPMEFVIRAEDFSLMVRPAAGFSTGPTAPPVSVAESVVQTQAPAKTVPPFSRHFPDGVLVSELWVNTKPLLDLPEARVRFYPNGTCDEFKIMLISLEEGEKLISLDVVTGLSEVEVIR